MNNNNLLLKSFIEDNFFIRYFLLIPLLTLLIFADIFLSIILSGLIGTYLYLSLILFYSLAGILIIIRKQNKCLSIISDNQKKGSFEESVYLSFISGIVSGIFIFIPGIITTTIGFILLFPFPGKLLGKYLAKKMDINWHELYEYQNIIKY